MNIRVETAQDYPIVFEIIASAFQSIKESDQTEHLLVARLRKSSSFIPALSFVAEINNKVVGHIILTKIKINDGKKSHPSLALAPVSVLPQFQRQGIGGMLILHAHYVARQMEYSSIVLLGHENYYPRFGYEKASKYKIKLPFPAPDENCMVIALTEDGLKAVSGTVEYDPAFYE